MKVENIGAFCNTFDLHYAIIGLENQFLVFLRVPVIHKFYCIFFFIVRFTATTMALIAAILKMDNLTHISLGPIFVGQRHTVKPSILFVGHRYTVKPGILFVGHRHTVKPSVLLWK